jgi:hypothetical protein
MTFSQGVQSSSSDSAVGDFSLHTFRGCLTQSGNQYSLIVVGASPRQYRLLGSNLTQLDGKAGHVVSITGTLPQSSQASVGINLNTESEAINFLALEDVASTCTASSNNGTARETTYSRAFATVVSEPDSQSQSSSYMIIPLVGVLALGLLQVAHYRRK